ncbi:MAG: hypothetical protein QOF06_2114 [Solirubrobacterales bacterium]|jgi:hypothetical protein|nr:hypothetical protein [Solirubrobacterales bacterium]
MSYLQKLGLTTAAVFALIAFAGVGPAAATTLEVGGVAKNSSVAMTTTLKTATSLIIKDEFGTTTDTCTGSTIKGQTEGTFTGASVGGKLSQFTLTGCTHITVTISLGGFSHTWTSGTNGEVRYSGVEITVQSTFFGASALCKFGFGTAWGIIKGLASGKSIVDIVSKLNCGILGTATVTGTYLVTSPEGLGVVS